MDVKILGIAGAAGIASVLAVYSALHAGAAGFPLFILGALPIYIAALGWGTHAGVAASIIAIIVAATLISPQAGVAVGLSLTIPASIIGHQANLAQETEDGKMEWYPLSQLLFNLAVVLSIALVALGYVMDYASYSDSPEISATVSEFLRQNPPPTPLSDEEVAQLTQSVFRLLPFMFAGMWLIVHITNLQLAALICRGSGKLPRPKDDIPASANMPNSGLFVLVASMVALLVLDGSLQSAAAVVCGTFLMAYAMVGLAGTHFQARSNPTSFFFLILSYIIIIIFFAPLFLFAIGGVIRGLSKSKNTPPPAGQNHS
ncbi:MAG: hypothetical protein AAGA53_02965 [Pseudomonadota bacterium]